MRFAILGLLLVRPMSLYDLRKAFEAGVGLLYSASTGSIKRALDGLLADGLVAIDAAEPTGRRRTTHAITDAGRAAFHDWMVGEPTGTDAEAAALPRLFFLGHLPPGERAGVVARVEARFAADLAGLEALATRVDAMPVPPEHRDLATSQRTVLDYGLASHRHALAWLRAHPDRSGA